MDITIPVINYKVNLEILILIGILYLIMTVHTVCSCCDISGIIESFKGGDIRNSAKRNRDMRNRRSNDSSKNNNRNMRNRMNRNNQEGFVSAGNNFGDSSPYDINNDSPIDTSAWMQPNMTVVPGQPLDPAVQSILDRPEQPFPLPEGEMLMFANTPFKPECCPNTYSNSSGCACMTVGQYNGLVTRGGNNVPYSEY